MSWLDRFSTDRRRVEGLLEQADFRTALSSVQEQTGPEAAAYAEEIGRRAAHHWLRQAEDACQRGERKKMNAALAEAARYYRDDLGPMFREARRRIRVRILELTTAPHWLVLLHGSVDQRAAYFGEGADPPPRYRAFANPKLLTGIGARLRGTPTTAWLERLDENKLDQVRDLIVPAYPATLADPIDSASPDFLRGMLHTAAGRPDLAVLPLLEETGQRALVGLELARVSYALGFPGAAMQALSQFTSNHGGHAVVRRLHTGVFMAQMALQSGDPRQAVEILESIPLHEVGRRPVLLYARLLARIGQTMRSRAVLSDWLAENPDDDEASALLAGIDDPSLHPDEPLIASPE